MLVSFLFRHNQKKAENVGAEEHGGAEADPAARPAASEPNRGGRDHPAAVQCAEGAGGELPGRGHDQRERAGEGGRPQAHPDPGQWLRHRQGGPADRVRALHHLQAQGVRRPQEHQHFRLPRRGPRQHQPRQQTHHRQQNQLQSMCLQGKPKAPILSYSIQRIPINECSLRCGNFPSAKKSGRYFDVKWLII